MNTRIRDKFAAHSLGLGGAPIGNLYQSLSDEEAENTIKTAWKQGIRYYDTAPLYGYGLSELRLGKALRHYPRNEFILSTKVGRLLTPDDTTKNDEQFPGARPYRITFDYSYNGIIQSYKSSVERLGFAPDIILVHDLGEMTHGDKHLEMLNTFKTSGIKAVAELQKRGIAIGLGVNETAICLEIMPLIKLDFIMLAGRYTLLEQESLKDFFPACEHFGIAVIIAGPYNSGILSGDTNNHHYNYQAADSKIEERVQLLSDKCKQHGIELPRAAIQFPYLHPQVISVVTGAKSPKEILQSVSNYSKPIPGFFWSSLKQAGLIAMTSSTKREHDDNHSMLEFSSFKSTP